MPELPDITLYVEGLERRRRAVPRALPGPRLARALSQLLWKDWPNTLEEFEGG